MHISQNLITQLHSLIPPAIIGISGVGGSGKTTLAVELGQRLNIPVISIDSFQKPGAFDSEYKLWEIMDFDRLEQEVLIPFNNDSPVIEYRYFDPRLNKIAKTKAIKNEGYLIIEGVGLFRQKLINYFQYKIWIDVPVELAIERGKRRDKMETSKLWEGIWKDNDNQYIEEFNPKSYADIVVKNS